MGTVNITNFQYRSTVKPNQPNQRIKVPKVASGILAPGIALACPSLLYLPIRGPSSNTPAKAAQAPTICTMPDPAKSLKPILSKLNKPNTSVLPQPQLPPMG